MVQLAPRFFLGAVETKVDAANGLLAQLGYVQPIVTPAAPCRCLVTAASTRHA